MPRENNISFNTAFLRGITRNIFILGLVSFFTDVGSQMVFPLLPLYLTKVLGLGAYAVGIVEGAAQSGASLLKVFSGYWSDKISKRKPFVLWGYALSALTKPLFALCTAWSAVLSVRIIERVGKGVRTAPRDAIVAESCEPGVRGRAYGLQRAMDGIGSVVGAIAAFLLLPLFGYRTVFLLAFFPGVLAVIAIMFVKEKRNKQQASAQKQSIKLSFAALSRDLKLYIITASLFSFGHFGYAFLLLKAKSIGFTDSTTLFLYVIFYVSYTLCVVPLGMVSDRFGRKPILLAGYCMFALISAGAAMAVTLKGIMTLFILYGVCYAMLDGAQRAFVIDLAPQRLKATALGAFHTAIGLVALPGGFIAGLLWDMVSPHATFAFGCLFALVSLVLFVFIRPKK